MKVIVTGGQHKGKTGTMNGDLSERRKTLGKDGKVMVKFVTGEIWKPNDIVFIRTKHLSEGDLFT